jgi:hypothetical protein
VPFTPPPRIGKPRKATGVDIGQGVVVRFDEKRREVTGFTILGVRARLVESLRRPAVARR